MGKRPRPCMVLILERRIWQHCCPEPHRNSWIMPQWCSQAVSTFNQNFHCPPAKIHSWIDVLTREDSLNCMVDSRWRYLGFQTYFIIKMKTKCNQISGDLNRIATILSANLSNTFIFNVLALPHRLRKGHPLFEIIFDFFFYNIGPTRAK